MCGICLARSIIRSALAILAGIRSHQAAGPTRFPRITWHSLTLKVHLTNELALNTSTLSPELFACSSSRKYRDTEYGMLDLFICEASSTVHSSCQWQDVHIYFTKSLWALCLSVHIKHLLGSQHSLRRPHKRSRVYLNTLDKYISCRSHYGSHVFTMHANTELSVYFEHVLVGYILNSLQPQEGSNPDFMTIPNSVPSLWKSWRWAQNGTLFVGWLKCPRLSTW